MAYNAIICKYGMMILVWEVLRLSMNRTCWLLGVSIENTIHTPSKLQYELDFIKTVMTVEDFWCMIKRNHESCRNFQEFSIIWADSIFWKKLWCYHLEWFLAETLYLFCPLSITFFSLEGKSYNMYWWLPIFVFKQRENKHFKVFPHLLDQSHPCL